MSSLQDKLNRIKESFAKQVPAEAAAVMARATQDLRESGILSRIPKSGDSLISFELENTSGEQVRSQSLVANGPLVITFYRGVW